MGKSSLSLAIASVYLKGGAFPDNQPFQGEMGKVVRVEKAALNPQVNVGDGPARRRSGGLEDILHILARQTDQASRPSRPRINGW